MGIFVIKNEIVPGSEKHICDDCYFEFGMHVNQMKVINDARRMREEWEQAKHRIQASTLQNKDMLFSELEELLIYRGFDPSILEQDQISEEERIELEKMEEAKKKRATAQMLITSGFQFDGYRITKYSGYISGDDAIQVSRGTDSGWFGGATDVGEALMASLVKIRRNALQELKEAAYELGCNAVIGVDFDYLTLEPETANYHGGTTYLPYVFGVTANGNAVVIEKIEEDEQRRIEQDVPRRRRNTLTAADLIGD